MLIFLVNFIFGPNLFFYREDREAIIQNWVLLLFWSFINTLSTTITRACLFYADDLIFCDINNSNNCQLINRINSIFLNNGVWFTTFHQMLRNVVLLRHFQKKSRKRALNLIRYWILLCIPHCKKDITRIQNVGLYFPKYQRIEYKDHQSFIWQLYEVQIICYHRLVFDLYYP